MAQSTLILTQSDIRRLVSRGDYLRAIEDAFRASAKGEAVSPAPLHVEGANGGFHGKAALLHGDRSYFALKLNSNFPQNPKLHSLPTVQGALLLFDGENGALLAVMDAIEITLMRTAAATALAARYLARPDARIVTICGCGAQARSQLQALADVRRLSRGFAWDIDQSRATEFAAEMSNLLGIRIDVPSSLDTATRQSDIIVTCTTAREPFLDESIVSAGTFIAAVGADAPAKNEIEPAFVATASVFADVTVQAIVMGDLYHAIASGLTKADHIRGELADLVSDRVPGRTSDDEIIIFDSTGTAIEDVASAAVVYERALSADVLRVDLAST